MKQRRRPVLALACSCALMVAATGCRIEIAELRRSELTARQDLDRRNMQAQAHLSANVAPPAEDFTQSLPEAVSLDTLVQTLQRSATAFNATIVTVSGEQQPKTVQALPRLVVSLTLQGNYAAIKSTLAEALSRYPTAIFDQLSMKRAGALAGSEEATIRLILPLRPTDSNRSTPLEPAVDSRTGMDRHP